MSLLGKVLAILNVLAVLGALALMGMSYGKQMAWEYKVFQQKLLMDGLPVDEGERDQQNRPLADNIGTSTQKDLFPQNPVTTQKAEVERVRGQLQSKIQGAGDKKKQIYLLARVLTPMALTHAARERLIAYQTHLRDDNAVKQLGVRLKQVDDAAAQLLKDQRAKTYEEAFNKAVAAQHADPLGPLAEAFLEVKKADPRLLTDKALEQALDKQLVQLQGQFDQMFRDALEGTATADAAKTGASPQKRRIIAFLLLNMVDVLPDEAAGGAAAKPANLWEDPKYKRFLNVVGVRAAAGAINDEAALLQEIADEVEAARLRERGVFTIEHRKAVDLVLEKSSLVEAHNLMYARKQKELADHVETLKARREDVKFYEDQLKTIRQQTKAHLGELRRMSDQLFQERVKLRDATQRNQELEKDIRALEGVP
ncbi:MAG TPA: hypothetical protein VH682_18240 [Gemmataceae bacterium]